jgi:fructosamine-3-kinase
MHAAGTGGQFGAPWTGYVGSAPMDNGPAASWPEFYANRRLTPYVRQLRDRGALTGADAAVFDHLTSQLPTVTGPPEEPARLHGDLWNGNLLWGADGAVWLVDPAAHGGHRETDLAMLQLFGVPFRTRIIAGYRESATDLGRPLADGWEERIAVHQLFPLLVHAVLFGGGYLRQALAVARRYAR